MIKELNYVEIVKSILGEELYVKLLMDVAKENNQNEVGLVDYFNEVFNKYCFILLMLGTNKMIDINTFKLNFNEKDIKIDSKEFMKKYGKYIKVIEEKKFKKLKTIIKY